MHLGENEITIYRYCQIGDWRRQIIDCLSISFLGLIINALDIKIELHFFNLGNNHEQENSFVTRWKVGLIKKLHAIRFREELVICDWWLVIFHFQITNHQSQITNNKWPFTFGRIPLFAAFFGIQRHRYSLWTPNFGELKQFSPGREPLRIFRRLSRGDIMNSSSVRI